MNLYLIERLDNGDYDTYSEAVVAAPDAEAARRIHPGGGDAAEDRYETWIDPSQVKVTHIGIALDHIERGVICASYHAG